jgi:hypothetical protein
MPSSYTRQVFQSLIQFAIVFCTGMLVFDKVPTSLDQLWQPTVQGILAALSIWAASKANVGGPPEEDRRGDDIGGGL